VTGFDNKMAAETARANLLKVKDGAVEIKPQDAIVVVKTPENTIQLKSDFEYSPDGILFGSWFGMLVGFLLGIPFGPLGPLVGTTIGTALGAITGALADALTLTDLKKK
jgi:uncharacterized membrane protein